VSRGWRLLYGETRSPSVSEGVFIETVNFSLEFALFTRSA
jgi:hypothetical protein